MRIAVSLVLEGIEGYLNDMLLVYPMFHQIIFEESKQKI